MFVWSS